MRHVLKEKKCVQDFGGETLKGRGVYRIILLKWTLMKYDRNVWIRSIWLRIGKSGGF
jgi:hypothetical protein